MDYAPAYWAAKSIARFIADMPEKPSARSMEDHARILLKITEAVSAADGADPNREASVYLTLSILELGIIHLIQTDIGMKFGFPFEVLQEPPADADFPIADVKARFGLAH